MPFNRLTYLPNNPRATSQFIARQGVGGSRRGVHPKNQPITPPHRAQSQRKLRLPTPKGYHYPHQ